ncbi:hypothetical protein BDZ45DRAFT_644319 [Acephala macrosclerotiorum]|nr:hypothetical protein BDZ45DRAFT_644319 [Acephala macrosclerotiorum]
MESLSLEDPALQGAAQMPSLGPGMPPPQNQQLPPQMFTTAAQLLDLTDKKLMVALRDGRKLIGVLRSWDQFANLVLQSTVERIFVPPPTASINSKGATATLTEPGLYADVPRGIFLVRGENVTLLGEIDLDKDDDAPPGYEKADVETVHRLNKERKAKELKREKGKRAKLIQLGFEGEVVAGEGDF